MGGLSGLPRGSEVRLEVSPWNGPKIVGFSFAAVALMLLVYIGETEADFPSNTVYIVKKIRFKFRSRGCEHPERDLDLLPAAEEGGEGEGDVGHGVDRGGEEEEEERGGGGRRWARGRIDSQNTCSRNDSSLYICVILITLNADNSQTNNLPS